MRNIGGSVGIATVTPSWCAALKPINITWGERDGGRLTVTRMLHGLETKFYLEGGRLHGSSNGLGTLYRMVQQQASLLAYADNFRLLGYLPLVCIPLAVFFHGVRKRSK